jgi:hypothetical protein
MVELFTGQCHLKGHFFKLEMTDDRNCESCLEEDESAIHILCDCEAKTYLRFRHLGQSFLEPSYYYDAPINTSSTFNSKCRINKSLIKGEAQYIINGRGARAGLWPTPHSSIHSFIHGSAIYAF